MAAAPPRIIVNASFPRKQFSHRPYKWIRYAIGVVVGAFGDLSTTPDLSGVVDYNAGLPADSIDLYYHTDEDERRRMFPIDPDIVRTQLTTRVSAKFCHATHLLAHSKANDHISTLTHHRGRDNEADLIEDIDSVRNGIFLCHHGHVILGSDLAFLVTPNFAINTADVDDTAPPGQKRYTAHIIQNGETFPSDCVPGSSFRITENAQFPPDILFDAVYAGFVLLHFGTEAMKDFARKWKDTYSTQREAAYGAITDERTTATGRSPKQALDRNERHERRTRGQADDLIGTVMAIPYILVSPDEHLETMRQAREEAEAAEQRRVHEKVEEWIGHVDTA
ncbi:hypothetical protein EDB92DRAFT_2113349 [Lactarius akahatsu]|uniref:HNH nuclease domain-containing protein n=1 Tax=Lactarius akahatsu TaxID=416441 RepID=A0AAD4LKQ5_9AGAM|nr:hypothetical protein EDB92DRAFT_2113349 [Lactarius akahatsu]